VRLAADLETLAELVVAATVTKRVMPRRATGNFANPVQVREAGL
jgi:hypothetical protein